MDPPIKDQGEVWQRHPQWMGQPPGYSLSAPSSTEVCSLGAYLARVCRISHIHIILNTQHLESRVFMMHHEVSFMWWNMRSYDASQMFMTQPIRLLVLRAALFVQNMFVWLGSVLFLCQWDLVDPQRTSGVILHTIITNCGNCRGRPIFLGIDQVQDSRVGSNRATQHTQNRNMNWKTMCNVLSFLALNQLSHLQMFWAHHKHL